MPSHLQRYYGANHWHFIRSLDVARDFGSGLRRPLVASTWSCYHHHQAWLARPQRRELYLKVLEQVRQRYPFVVAGYVVMPEHIPLLISEPEKGNPSRVLQALKQGFARRVLPKRRTTTQAELFAREAEPVWQRRFYDCNVWSERKRIEKLRYMHRNPVKRGLVLEPEQWRWSSYRDYAYGEAGAVQINQ